MAIKFSDFTAGATISTTELVGYNTGTTTNTRYSLEQVGEGIFGTDFSIANFSWINSTSRLGIGEASPDSIVHIKATAPNLRLEGNAALADDDVANILFYNGTDNVAKIRVKRGADAADGEIEFFTANDSLNTAALHIDQNSLVGIGVTTPDSFLEVFGDGSVRAQQKWSHDPDSFATMTVADTSNTTLAVGEAGTFTLDVAGNVTIDSDTGVITFADGGASLATVASLRNECFMIACSDETTDITAAADKVRIQMPYAFTLTEIKASLTTAPTGSGATTVNIYNVTDGDTVINTAALSFAAAAISANSTSFTAGQETIAEDAVIAVDVAAIAGTTGGAGLKVTLIGHQTP